MLRPTSHGPPSNHESSIFNSPGWTEEGADADWGGVPGSEGPHGALTRQGWPFIPPHAPEEHRHQNDLPPAACPSGAMSPDEAPTTVVLHKGFESVTHKTR